MVIDVHCHVDIGTFPISLNIEYTAPVSISMFIIFFNIVHIINAGGVNMDNLNATATGGSLGDDNTGFVTPSFMDGLNNTQKELFSCKEEWERFNYKLEHEHDNNNLK